MTQTKFPSTKTQFTRLQAAEYLTAIGYKISRKTLENLASNNNAGNGPPFTRSGWNHPVVYERSDLDLWVAARTSKINCSQIPLHNPEYPRRRIVKNRSA